MNHCFFYFRCMALRDLVKAVSPEFATDREIQGDQVDLKINDLRRDLWAVCDAIDGSIGPAGNKLGYYYYSQGSSTEGNIYGTWADLMSAVTAGPPAPHIIVTASTTIPVGTYNLRRASLYSTSPNTGEITLTALDGVVLHDLYKIDNGLHLVMQPSLNPALTYSWPSPGILQAANGAVISNLGSVPLVQVSGGNYFVLGIFVSSTQAVPPSTAPIVNGSTGAVIIGAGLLIGPFGGFPDNWVTGDVTCNLIYQNGPDAQISISTPGYLGATSVSAVAVGGDLSGTLPSPTVTKIRNTPISAAAPTTGQYFVYTGTQWEGADFDMPVIKNLTYTTAPTLEGQVYVIIDDDTVNLGIATSLLACEAVAGTWDSVKLGLKAVRGWPVNIRLEPGLTPIAGDILYVSETTAGLATNVIPATLGNYVKPIGHVLNALAYSPLDMTGSVVTGLLDIDAAKVI